MNVIEAITYCIGFISDVAEDGEYRSQTAYDCNGDPHWFAWEVKDGDVAMPRPCSESPTPFAKRLEPYRT